jgi:hypothetical protein
MSELAIPEQQQLFEILQTLEKAGAVDAVSLNLTDPDMPYERWEDLGRFLGGLGRRVNWYLGDWLNFGEMLYGQEASQAIDATTQQRYDEAERVTGLDHGTLMNIRSICGRIARERRRPELGFWIHAAVAPLDPEEQIEWLQRAIDESWTRAQLQDAIKDAKNPAPAEDDNDGGGGGGGGGLTISERVEQAARLVWHQCQPTTDGSVPRPCRADGAARVGTRRGIEPRTPGGRPDGT